MSYAATILSGYQRAAREFDQVKCGWAVNTLCVTLVLLVLVIGIGSVFGLLDSGHLLTLIGAIAVFTGVVLFLVDWRQPIISYLQKIIGAAQTVSPLEAADDTKPQSHFPADHRPPRTGPRA